MCICVSESASLGAASPLSISFIGVLGTWRMIAWTAFDFMPQTIREMDKLACLGLITTFGIFAYEARSISITGLLVLAALTWVHRRSCAEAGGLPGAIPQALTILVWIIALLRANGL